MLAPDLEAFVKEIVDRFRTLPNECRQHALKLLKSALKPQRRGGRRRDETVTQAQQMRAQPHPQPWPIVFQRCIPGYWQLSLAEQRMKGENLKKAVKARRRRQQDIVPPTNEPDPLSPL